VFESWKTYKNLQQTYKSWGATFEKVRAKLEKVGESWKILTEMGFCHEGAKARRFLDADDADKL